MMGHPMPLVCDMLDRIAMFIDYNCTLLTFECIFIGFRQQHCDGKSVASICSKNVISLNSDICMVPPLARPKHTTTNIKNQFSGSSTYQYKWQLMIGYFLLVDWFLWIDGCAMTSNIHNENITSWYFKILCLFSNHISTKLVPGAAM